MLNLLLIKKVSNVLTHLQIRFRKNSSKLICKDLSGRIKTAVGTQFSVPLVFKHGIGSVSEMIVTVKSLMACIGTETDI